MTESTVCFLLMLLNVVRVPLSVAVHTIVTSEVSFRVVIPEPRILSPAWCQLDSVVERGQHPPTQNPEPGKFKGNLVPCQQVPTMEILTCSLSVSMCFGHTELALGIARS